MNTGARLGIAGVAALIIVGAVWHSKRKSIAVSDSNSGDGSGPAPVKGGTPAAVEGPGTQRNGDENSVEASASV